MRKCNVRFSFKITESVLARTLLAKAGHLVEGEDFRSASTQPSRYSVRTPSEPPGFQNSPGGGVLGRALTAHDRVLGAHGGVLTAHDRVLTAHGGRPWR